MKNPIRVLIVDVHDDVREPLTTSLARQDEFEVVLSTAESSQAMEHSAELAPDLLLVDIRQLDEAVSLCRDFQQTYSQTKLIILSSFVSDWERRMFQELGAIAFLSKEGSFQSLLTDIKSQLSEVLAERTI